MDKEKCQDLPAQTRFLYVQEEDSQPRTVAECWEMLHTAKILHFRSSTAKEVIPGYFCYEIIEGEALRRV